MNDRKQPDNDVAKIFNAAIHAIEKNMKETSAFIQTVQNDVEEINQAVLSTYETAAKCWNTGDSKAPTVSLQHDKNRHALRIEITHGNKQDVMLCTFSAKAKHVEAEKTSFVRSSPDSEWKISASGWSKLGEKSFPAARSWINDEIFKSTVNEASAPLKIYMEQAYQDFLDAKPIASPGIIFLTRSF